MYISRYACHFLIKLGFALQIFEKSSNMNFHENPSNRSRGICGRTDRQKDMTWPIVAFRNFVNSPIEFPYNTLQIKTTSSYQPCASVYALTFLFKISKLFSRNLVGIVFSFR
jgi:hypothetical protein